MEEGKVKVFMAHSIEDILAESGWNEQPLPRKLELTDEARQK